MGTDEVCHAEATAFIEGSSGCVFKKIFFFLKKETTKHLPSGKTNKSIKGAKKPARSKLKDGYVRKTNTSKV